MGNWIALIAIIVIAVAAIVYIVRAKKKGKKCIGCPDGCCTPTAKQDESPCAHCCGCSGGASCSSKKDN